MAYSDKLRVLHALANCMKRADITEKVTVIGRAKVPIIKFVTKLGRFAVDISINQLNGVAAGRMVNRFLQELPALRALVVVIKSFLSQRSMNEVFTGGLGSYSIVCLAASFLQMHPKIRRGEIDPVRNLGVLVMEFFELYGLYFNYRDVGISLRDGGTYYNKFRRGWADFKNEALLSIEDPADPGSLTRPIYTRFLTHGRCSKRYIKGLVQYHASAPDTCWCARYHDRCSISTGRDHQCATVRTLHQLSGRQDGS